MPKVASLRPRFSLPLALSLAQFSLVACSDDPSFEISWKITDDAEKLPFPDTVEALANPRQCSDVGVQRVQVRTFDQNRILVDEREFACFPDVFANDKGVGGPELPSGEYQVELRGLRRSGQPWCPSIAAEPADRDCPVYEIIDEDESCQPCIARNATSITIEKGKRTQVDALALLAPSQCDDGVDNDRDGRVDELDPACLLDPEGLESADADVTVFRLNAEFLEIPSATCTALGITHFRVNVDEQYDELVVCANSLPPISVPIDSGEHILQVTAVTATGTTDPADAVPLTTSKEIPFSAGNFVQDTLAFSANDFLEPIVSPAEFTVSYAGSTLRSCEPAPNQPNLLTLDSLTLSIHDENGELLPPETLAFDEATINEDGSVTVPCPIATLRTQALTWGKYTVTASALNDEATCYAHGEEESTDLLPGIVVSVELPRILNEQTQPPEGCFDCNRDSDCGDCTDCCIENVCIYPGG